MGTSMYHKIQFLDLGGIGIQKKSWGLSLLTIFAFQQLHVGKELDFLDISVDSISMMTILLQNQSSINVFKRSPDA